MRRWPIARLIGLAAAAGLGPRLLLAALTGAAASACAIGLMATSAWLISRAAQHPPVLELTVAIVGVRAFAVGRSALRYTERLAGHDTALRMLGVAPNPVVPTARATGTGGRARPAPVRRDAPPCVRCGLHRRGTRPGRAPLRGRGAGRAGRDRAAVRPAAGGRRWSCWPGWPWSPWPYRSCSTRWPAGPPAGSLRPGPPWPRRRSNCCTACPTWSPPGRWSTAWPPWPVSTTGSGATPPGRPVPRA